MEVIVKSFTHGRLMRCLDWESWFFAILATSVSTQAIAAAKKCFLGIGVRICNVARIRHYNQLIIVSLQLGGYIIFLGSFTGILTCSRSILNETFEFISRTLAGLSIRINQFSWVAHTPLFLLFESQFIHTLLWLIESAARWPPTEVASFLRVDIGQNHYLLIVWTVHAVGFFAHEATQSWRGKDSVTALSQHFLLLLTSQVVLHLEELGKVWLQRAALIAVVIRRIIFLPTA